MASLPDLPEPEYPPGAHATAEGTHFTVWSASAHAIDVVLYAADHDQELRRVRLDADQGGWHHAFVETAGPDMRYGFRASGPYAPERGLWFDPAKLLMDPYAIAIDRPWRYDPELAEFGVDTAPLVPKAIITSLPDPPRAQAPLFAPGGLIYELNVRAFTLLHPDIPGDLRGTVAALGHEAVIAHLRKIGVAAVELMPIVAHIDERHLPPLGLTNIWGYNPVAFMALDPRLAPGGIAELCLAVERLHAAGIGVILDIVLNHSGESDAQGPTLCLRGLDPHGYFRHHDGQLTNETGCGNSIHAAHPAARRLILDTLRHFVVNVGIDGFRFDLAPVLGRENGVFNHDCQLFRSMLADPVLADRIWIAEPWDLGMDGYQLGNFPPRFLEWNDKYRDDMRRFWRGDPHMVGALATRLAGSSDIFQKPAVPATRGISFIGAHDGFTLADLVAFERKHNEANGEQNRDGHNENYSWNHGFEGKSDDPRIHAARHDSQKALLASLFATRGPIMLRAGDEFGHSAGGNNNAYAQDNGMNWLDWNARDRWIEQYVAELAAIRARHPILSDPHFRDSETLRWLRPDGQPFTLAEWDDPYMAQVAMLLPDIAILVNRSNNPVEFSRPAAHVPPRSILFVEGKTV